VARSYLVAVVAAVCGLGVTGVLLSGLFSFSNANESDATTHDQDVSTLPIDIKQVFDKREKGLDALGSNYVLVDEAFVDAENACDFCIGIAYTPGPLEAATLAFKRSEPVDLSPAKALTFDVRGETGSELIRIFALGVETENSVQVSGNQGSGLRGVEFAFSKEIKLDSQWQSYSVNIETLDRSQVTYAIAIQVLKGSESKDQTVYLDQMQFAAQKPDYSVSLN
jgi:hypothetical protein